MELALDLVELGGQLQLLSLKSLHLLHQSPYGFLLCIYLTGFVDLRLILMAVTRFCSSRSLLRLRLCCILGVVLKAIVTLLLELVSVVL